MTASSTHQLGMQEEEEEEEEEASHLGNAMTSQCLPSRTVTKTVPVNRAPPPTLTAGTRQGPPPVSIPSLIYTPRRPTSVSTGRGEKVRFSNGQPLAAPSWPSTASRLSQVSQFTLQIPQCNTSHPPLFNSRQSLTSAPTTSSSPPHHTLSSTVTAHQTSATGQHIRPVPTIPPAIRPTIPPSISILTPQIARKPNQSSNTDTPLLPVASHSQSRQHVEEDSSYTMEVTCSGAATCTTYHNSIVSSGAIQSSFSSMPVPPTRESNGSTEVHTPSADQSQECHITSHSEPDKVSHRQLSKQVYYILYVHVHA